MNILKRERQIQVIAMLCEGTSIRSVERITGVHRDTIMRLMVRVGRHCARILDERMRDLRCDELQLDETWSFLAKKQKRCRPDDPPEFGDQYLYLALDPVSKLVPWHLVGKRCTDTTYDFVSELSSRVRGSVQISTDGFAPYVNAIGGYFAGRGSHGQIIKTYGAELTEEHRYSPPAVIAVDRVWVRGTPRSERICTSHVERLNWSIRNSLRRFVKLGNGFSRKLENLEAAVAIFVAWYDFVKPHKALGGITPAMAAGVTDKFWSVSDLLPPDPRLN